MPDQDNQSPSPPASPTPDPAATLKSQAPIILGFLAIFIAAGAIVFLIRACGGDQPAPIATVSRTSLPPANDTRSGDDSPTTSIRNVNWKDVTGAQPLVRDVETVLYHDFNGDEREEALVLVRLEGSGAYLDYFVYTLANGQPLPLFEQREVSHGKVELGPGPAAFRETTAVYQPDDPNCCPGNLQKTVYQWSADDQKFKSVSVETVPNPDR